MVVWLTDGNASSVIHPILLMKFIAAILHSKESTWKWSRTSNVNRVWGFLKLARNSLAWMKCWSHSSDDLTQWHHRNEHLKIPVEDTTISSNWDQKFVPDSCVYVGLDWLTRSSISSNISRLDGLSTSTLSGMEEQLSGWWGRCIVSLPGEDQISGKTAHSTSESDGKDGFVTGDTTIITPNVWPKAIITLMCAWRIDLCWRSLIRILCLWLTYSSRNLFWVCLVLFKSI